MRDANSLLPYGSPNRQDKVRLFCIPHAGAGASAYLKWSTGSGIGLYPVQLPGRESRYREPLFTSLNSLADAMVVELRPYLDAPFALFGHSMGALLCYEFARRLEGLGIHPLQIFVSGRRAPHLPQNGMPLHLLPDDLLLEELRSLSGIPEQILFNADWERVLLPIVRADAALDETYIWQKSPPLNSSISAFGGAQDRFVHIEQIHAWGMHTTARFSLRVLPGGHFFVRSSYLTVLDIIERELARSLLPASGAWS
jgi:surfactin synthase thioesterase subunit